MNFELSKEKGQQLGTCEYLIKEGKVMKLLFFVGGLFAGSWLLYSHFILGYSWVYGALELPPVGIVILSVVLILFGLYCLVSMGKKSELEICNYGLRLNDKEIFYADIISIDIKRGFFVKIIVETAEQRYVYQASKFTRKDQKAIDEVRAFI